jgi:hypothetical protein
LQQYGEARRESDLVGAAVVALAELHQHEQAVIRIQEPFERKLVPRGRAGGWRSALPGRSTTRATTGTERRSLGSVR